MRYFSAFLVLGLAGYVGFLILSDGLGDENSGSSKTRLLRRGVGILVAEYGVNGAAGVVTVAGMALAVAFVLFGGRGSRDNE